MLYIKIVSHASKKIKCKCLQLLKKASQIKFNDISKTLEIIYVNLYSNLMPEPSPLTACGEYNNILTIIIYFTYTLILYMYLVFWSSHFIAQL